ncbi:MAG: FtsH protease activity modulator HflK [Steroidobacteraceae bacterium]
MAWNEPGNRGENPWGRKRPAGQSGGLEQTLRNFQQKLQAALGGGSSDEPPAGGTAAPPGGLGWIIAAVLLVLWLASGMFQVNASDLGVVQRFGRFNETVSPGWGWTFPWPIDKVTKVNVSQVNSVEYRSRVLTADVNLVDLRAAIQFQNADPVKVLFQVKDVDKTLAEVGESALREVVGQASLEEILGSARQRVTDSTRELIQRTLDSYNSGIRITSVNLTDVQVPDAVVAAQRDANKAIEDRERYSKEAQAYANDILPKAQGLAQRQLQDAEAYKAQVVSLAEGDVARFNSIYAAYAQAPEVTRQRMYIETIEQIMRETKKIILDSKGGAGSNMIYLPLDKLLERNAARTGAAAVPGAAVAAPPMEELPGVTVDGRSRGVR